MLGLPKFEAHLLDLPFAIYLTWDQLGSPKRLAKLLTQ